MDIKSIYGKHASLTVTRSHSSLSSISLKNQMSSKPHGETPKVLNQAPELSILHQSNYELEQRIMGLMNEMKKLKTVSKDLKKKEDEYKTLHESLAKSNEDLMDTKIKHERSQQLLHEVFKQIRNEDNEKLFELYPIVCKHIVRLKQKRNSLIIDDLVFSHNPVHSIHTAREFKVRSPYFAGIQVLATPKVRKLKFIKYQTNKANVKVDKKDETPKTDLDGLLERIKLLVNYIKK